MLKSATLSSDQPLDDQIAAVRAFNRFYTRKLGVLDQHLGKSPFSLSEARVIYELAHRDHPSASDIASALGLDSGYLSRILSSFARQRLIAKTTSSTDGRKSLLHLTDKGQHAFAKLNSESRRQIGAMLSAPSAHAAASSSLIPRSTIESMRASPTVGVATLPRSGAR